MNPPDQTPPEPAPSTTRHGIANDIVAGASVLALLYFARDVLVPITLALIVSLAVAPLVRVLRRVGLRQVPAVLVAATSLSIAVIGVVVMIGLQVVQIAASLPHYQSTLRAKVEILREQTVGRMQALQGAPPAAAPAPSSPSVLVPVEVRERPANALQAVEQVLSSVWVPLQTAGIVLVVLLFMLLEHEALRDRFIRLAGGADLRSTTAAINDAGERLSRFFVSQFAVNIAVGAVIWAGLAAIGVPHAGLWAVLTTVLRFVPYVGVAVAALSAALLAAAVDPGWSLVILTLALYAVVEALVSQLIEPHLFGHTTGLSPLSIVVAAIFWSWLWGPVGLVVSTPLTLCLVVAGRHVKALGFLDVLLGDAPALTMPQRFYQRALSGDSDEIIAAAREFLKRRPLAAYCDLVLMRALHLTRIDLAAGSITPAQQVEVRGAIVRVIEALGGGTRKRSLRKARGSVLDDLSPGLQLLQRRQAVSGHWQGPLAVPAGSIVVCIALGSVGDDLATEILVRILRDLHIDARHLSVAEFREAPPEGALPGSVAMVCIVSISPRRDEDSRRAVVIDVRAQLGGVSIMALLLPDTVADKELALAVEDVDLRATSFEEAAQHAIARFPVANGD